MLLLNQMFQRQYTGGQRSLEARGHAKKRQSGMARDEAYAGEYILPARTRRCYLSDRFMGAPRIRKMGLQDAPTMPHQGQDVKGKLGPFFSQHAIDCHAILAIDQPQKALLGHAIKFVEARAGLRSIGLAFKIAHVDIAHVIMVQ